ncbi:MAG TPA: HAD hydrolase-like protein [Solirubrobacterales bacterium]|nr:HAD hydrolase-like protein [Solirubrobacterales bacterium]
MIEAVLFDIDGTLITTGGAGGEAWKRAFVELYGSPLDIREVTESGMTDPEVGRVALQNILGRDPDRRELATAMAHYLRHLSDAVDQSQDYRVMPGIEELLERLVDAGHLLGLTTGNVEAAAHIKLARSGLNRFFSFGGYGSDSNQRTELTRCALDRARLVSGGVLVTDSAISVGDTPRDVAAGHGAGVEVVGVATGNFSVEELRQAGANWAIPDVANGFPV